MGKNHPYEAQPPSNPKLSRIKLNKERVRFNESRYFKKGSCMLSEIAKTLTKVRMTNSTNYVWESGTQPILNQYGPNFKTSP